MSTTKEPHLNGAYYGPPIPPPQPPTKTYHRPGRGSSSCNPLTCCCNCICGCIFNLICQILITIAVLVGIAVFVFWLIFRPNVPKLHVTDASLAQFDLSSTNNTLYYDLSLNMTFRNPNKRIGIYYDRIEARALYQGNRFSVFDLQPFYLGHKKENYVSHVFKGTQFVQLGSDLGKYNSDRDSGVYSIDVKLYIRIRFKVGWSKTPKFTPKMECHLKVPLESNNGTSSSRVSSTAFQPTKCDFDW